MHELGLRSSIVDAVEQRAGVRPVAVVTVRVGRLLHVHPEAFEQSFAVAAMGTVAEQARPRLVLLPVRARCTQCGTEWEGDGRGRLPHLRGCGHGAHRRRRVAARVHRVPGLRGGVMRLGIPGQVQEF